MTVFTTNIFGFGSFKPYIGFIIYWVIILRGSHAAASCQHSGEHCKITCTNIPDYGDVTIDLSTIDSMNGPRFLNIHGYAGAFTYDWNPCTKFSMPGSKACDGVNMCQQSIDGKSQFNAGSSLMVTYNAKNKHIVLHYNGGDQRVTNVTMLYEDGEKGRVSKVTEGKPKKYSMVLYTKYALHHGSSSSGISTGTIMVIVFFAVLVLYLGIGIAFLRYRREARGKEMIPNYEFWSKMPGLIKDGCIFSGGKAKDCFSAVKERTAKGQGENDQYEKI